MTGLAAASSGSAFMAHLRWSRRMPLFVRRALAVLFGNPESVQPGAAKSAAELDYEVGVHEAGHAVACRLLNDCVSLVSIVEDAQLGRAGVTISGSGGFPDLAMGRSVSDNYSRIDRMATVVDRHKPRDGESRDVAESWLAAVHAAVVKLMSGVAADMQTPADLATLASSQIASFIENSRWEYVFATLPIAVKYGSNFLSIASCSASFIGGFPVADKKTGDYSEQEARRRFETALRGARIAGHKPMESLIKKKPKAKAKPKKKASK